jgi:diacylglycerol kinase family enzyme
VVGSAPIFHVLNPNKTNRPLVEEFFEKRSTLPHVWVNRDSHPTHLETIVQWIVLEKIVHVAVWGGDGTFSRVIQKLYEEGHLENVSLSLIPVGTGNDFARYLGFSNWQKCIDDVLLKNGGAHLYDIGLLSHSAGTRVFINNAGFGRTQHALTKKRPSAWADITNFAEKSLTIESKKSSAPATSLALRAYLGIVFNAPYFNRGLHFFKDAPPNDRILDAVFVPPQGKLGLIFKFIRSRLGFPLWDKKMTRLKAESFVVVSDRDLFPQVDGEPASLIPQRRLTFSILKEKLTLIF